MECSVCGSQDTTFKQGISKTGKPWKAYDCNKPTCKNDKGYPSRTFVSVPKVAVRAENGHKQGIVGAGLEAKIDKILAILKENFPPVTHEAVNENEESPF